MISIARFLQDRSGDLTHAAVRACSLLMQGMGLHAFEYDRSAYSGLKAELNAIASKMNDESDPANLLVSVGTGLKIIEEYNRSARQHARQQVMELHGIVSTLTRAVSEMVQASDISLQKLNEIRTGLSAAEEPDELRTLKERLTTCLTEMTVEVESHKNRSNSDANVLNGLSNEFELRLSRMEDAQTLDPTTGLPKRQEAERVLAAAANEGIAAVAVVFVINRLKQVNSRFGYEVGDRVLEHCATYLGSGINPERGLFRWDGPVLVAVIARRAPLAKIRADIEYLLIQKESAEMDIGARKVLIPLGIGWAVFPVVRPLELLLARVAGFIEKASQSA